MDYSYNPSPEQQFPFQPLPPTPSHTNPTSNSATDKSSNSPPVCDPSPLYLSQPVFFYRSSSPSRSISKSQSQPQPYIVSPHSSRSQFNSAYPHSLTTTQDAFNYFQTYDYSQYASNAIPQSKPPTPQQNLGINDSSMFNMSLHKDTEEIPQVSISDDDDRDMTPAQSKRKAQNRAAQRAFRERKERRVKDLESKLAALERSSLDIIKENEGLKLQLQKTTTENEILKASSTMPSSSAPALPNTAPLEYTPTDFYSHLLQPYNNKAPSHRILTSEDGERLLAPGATWDYIIKHPLYSKGYVDVGRVSDMLRWSAKCDGQGPVYEESAVLGAIEKSVASGSDELL